MKSLFFFLFGVALFGVVSAQLLQPQCKCDQVETCKEAYVDAIKPCADVCEKYAVEAGANYTQLRACFMKREDKIKQALKCTEKTLEESCTKDENAPPVPKRHVETLKLAALEEIDKILTKSGVNKQVKKLVLSGKSFYGCMKKCMDEKANHCASKMNCGLKLPSDGKIVQNFKTCAIEAGFGTSGVHELCECAVKAGVTKLESICEKLQIS